MRERERAGREPHDTLLQGFQGLALGLQAVADDLPPRSAERERLERILSRADQLLLEGRERLVELRRPSPALGPLAQVLAETGRDLSQYQAARFRLTVEGAPRTLAAPVHEGTCLVAREALFNAFEHARATRIVLEIVYGRGALALRVRDDGAGLPGRLLAAGSTPGRGGMAAMREHARQVGGRLQVWSRAGAGTEIALEIPASRAYALAGRT